MIVHLESEAYQGDEVTVETDRKDSYISTDAPVRTEVIGANELKKQSRDGGLLSALSKKTGLDTRPCALCGSAGVGMQGLDASYTEVRVDGMPVLSGLGTLYGLDGLSVADISQVELVKGSGSSLFGSGAIAGGVNLVTAKPTDKTSYNFDIGGGSTGQHSLSANASGLTGNFPMRLSLSYANEPRKLDYDHDGLTDNPQYLRYNINYGIGRKVSFGNLKLNARYYDENRFAGETRWTESDRGSATVYGRDIRTHREELFAGWTGNQTKTWRWAFETALVNHEQDSWYGQTSYNARQKLGSAKLTTSRSWSAMHSSLIEGSFNYTEYNDNLQINAKTDMLYQVPGLTMQHTWTPSTFWTLQGGARVEHYNNEGIIVTPRGSAVWAPNQDFGLRASAGTGYRPVSIFSLNEAVHAGFEHVSVPEKLTPEKSTAFSLAMNKRWLAATSAFMLDISTFYTNFSNKVVLSYTPEVGHTEYTNAKEAYSAGVELQATWVHTTGWKIGVGGRRSDVKYRDETSTWTQQSLMPFYTANGSLSKNWVKPKITAELSAALTGPQDLPEGRDKSQTPSFTMLDFNLTKVWKAFSLTGSVRNLLDWTQTDDPYLRDANGNLMLDSSLFYGPLLGRTFHLNMAYSFGG